MHEQRPAFLYDHFRNLVAFSLPESKAVGATANTNLYF